MSLLAFLQHCLPEKIADLGDDPARKLFRLCLVAVEAANKFMTTLYHASFWLTSTERRALVASGHECLNAFVGCATITFRDGKTRFKMHPKMHMFGEVVTTLEFQERSSLPSPNPLIFSTQQDEDFVGRICTISRRVSCRTIHMRTLSRYQIALASLGWWLQYFSKSLITSKTTLGTQQLMIQDFLQEAKTLFASPCQAALHGKIKRIVSAIPFCKAFWKYLSSSYMLCWDVWKNSGWRKTQASLSQRSFGHENE